MSKDNFQSNKFYILSHKKVNDTDTEIRKPLTGVTATIF